MCVVNLPALTEIPVTLGVEEEVFVLEDGRETPTLQSLDYLRRLWWSNPKKWAATTHSNFARGADRRECFMGSIEIATGVHRSPDSLIEDLIERRAALARAAEGARVVPTGSLYTLSSPSNTASTHIHVGVPKEHRDTAYKNLARVAPALAIASANSPFGGGKPYTLSFRLEVPGLIGPLREDPEYRFQDLIISKRLGTIELRLCDPIPEAERLRAVLAAVQAVAAYPEALSFDRETYNSEREKWTKGCLTDFVQEAIELAARTSSFSADWVCAPLGRRVGEIAERDGFDAAYRELDRIWREPTGVPLALRPPSATRAVTGLVGYYAVRLPWIAYKGYKEWYGRTP